MRGDLSLKIMGKGECFGEEEILLKRGSEFQRITTVKCVSEKGLLYCISKKELIRRLYADDDMRKMFRSQLIAK